MARPGVAQRVRAAWTDILQGATDVDPGQRFLDAGGHSLAAARLVARLEADLAIRLPMSVILREDPSLDQLIEVVAQQADAAPLAVDPIAGSPAAHPVASSSAGSAPLAPTMRRIWIWHQLQPDSPAYNVLRVLELDGRVQPAALRAALADLTIRHEALRCAVVEPEPGRPEIRVGDPVPVPLAIEVVRDTDGDPITAVEAALYRVADRPFPMPIPPLWRVGVVYSPEQGRSWLILVMHHLISDLRCSDLVLAELAEAYQARLVGESPDFTAPAPSLLDHLVHEARQVGSSRWEEHLGWWSRRLSAAGPATPLPLAAAAQKQPSHAGSTHSVRIPAAESDAVDRVLRQRRLTPALFFLTAASAVLAAWSGQDRAEMLGLPSVRISRPEDERLVGFLLDTLPLPLPVDRRESFLDAYHRTRDAFADATDHALPAFDDIVERLRVPRAGGARAPLIKLWFNDLTRATAPARFGELSAVEYDLPPAWALFDLNLYLRRSPAGYRLHLVSPRSSAQPADLRALVEQIGRLAVSAAADPIRPVGELLAPPAQPAAPGVPEESRTRVAEPTVRLLTRHASQRPAAVAVADPSGALDYRSLRGKVERVAARLRADAGSGAVVAVPARRDRRFVARLLACWRAGVTAVLVDAEWPQWRRDRALAVAGVTHAFPWSGAGPAAAVADPVRAAVAGAIGGAARAGSGASHVLFTSGTTGDPLPVRVATAAAESALADLIDRLGVTAADRVSMLSGPAHDPVLRDLGLALRVGAAVCVPPPAVFRDPGRLSGWLRQERVSVVNATPTMLALALRADPRPLPQLRVVVCGGSPLTTTTAELIRSCAVNALLVNGYGCTETPQLVTGYDIAPGQSLPPTPQVPIGEPLPGRQVEVRTADGGQCDVGHLGEVWVAAPHIAQGYLGDVGIPRFGTDQSGLRWFRTGDLARRDASDRLHLAGRTDRQVLVNGYRVVLEEIESVARSYPGVTDAIAQVIGAEGQQAVRVWVQTVAEALAPGRPLVSEDAVRAHLAELLPPSAVPARVLLVDRLRVSENLKPIAPELDPVAERMPAPSPLEGQLRKLAESMLGRRLDPTANFFDAGFTSISLLQLSAELTDLVGRPVEPLSVFEHPNLQALHAFLFGSSTNDSAAPTFERGPAADTPGVDNSNRVARMRANRRQVRTWVRSASG